MLLGIYVSDEDMIKQKKDLSNQRNTLIYFTVAFNILMGMEYLINEYIFNNLPKLIPNIDPLFVTIMQIVCLQFFTFLLNDQISDYLKTFFMDEFFSLPFQLLAIVRLNINLFLNLLAFIKSYQLTNTRFLFIFNRLYFKFCNKLSGYANLSTINTSNLYDET